MRKNLESKSSFLSSYSQSLRAFLEVLILCVAIGFLFGDLVVGGLVWLIHGTLVGEFGHTVNIRVFFGIVFSAIGFIAAVVIISGIFSVKKNGRILRIGSMILLGGITILSMCLGIIEYERINIQVSAWGNSFSDAYPITTYLMGCLLLLLASYVNWRELKEGDSDTAVLKLIFLGLAFILMTGYYSFYVFKIF